MTQFLDTPVNKSLSATGAWTDIDLSEDVPASATGAIFEVVNTHSTSSYQFGLRKKGSTDNTYKHIWDSSHIFAIIGIDTSRKCQGKIESTYMDFHLVGYTEADATFFTNAYDKSQTTLGAWTDLDLGSELPAGSVAAIFQIENVNATSSRSWSLREKGSTDDRYAYLSGVMQMFFIIGVDTNRKCQFKIESADINFYLVGYLTLGASETNGVDRSIGSTGSYVDITESNAPSGATGAFGETASTGVYSWAARKNGSSGDFYKDTSQYKSGIFVGLDSSKKWEGKIENTGLDFYTLGYFALGVTTHTKTFSVDTILKATSTKTFTADVIVVNRNTKTFTADVVLKGTNTKTFTADVILKGTNTKTFTADVISVAQYVKTLTADTILKATSTKIFTADTILKATSTKIFTADVIAVNQYVKTLTADVIAVNQYVKTLTADTILKATSTKIFTADVIAVNQYVKTLTADTILKATSTKTFTADVMLIQTADERGFYYAKLGSTILTSLEKDSFRITEELNKIPSFEFEISNCSANRTAIAVGITDTLTIYRRLDSTDTLMFTGRIDVDAIEYLSLERIRIPGYASYIDLNFRFHQHLNSEDAEDVGKVFDYSSTYTDYTTAANNDTINDVLLTLDSVGDIVYIGHSEQFFGVQVKYSTKGVQAGSTTVVFEFSKGSGVWSTLDVLDETRAFTEDAGTYYITIPHKPSDWAKETVNSIKKFWIRARVTAGSYIPPPKLDRIKITNVDVYRVYYFDTAANSIMDDVLAGTGYSMDGTDVCPADTISMVGEYETKLRFIAGVANALTWDDSGDKKAYQWWVDTSKKVHMKQERGTVRGNITQDLVILNNVVDYFNLSNRLHFLGNYDGLNQLKAVIEDTSSQDTHAIRELAVPEERYNNYIPLKEAAQKAMTHTKAPLQKIPATLPTTKWLANNLEVGDTVTIHQPRWNIDEQALQIVRADIGPSTTKLDIGISQEHLDGLKAGLQRRLDISGIRMHGSTLILQFGPNEMNYQRVDADTVYPSRLKFEIPNDARYIHKVVISWKMGPYRADVTGGAESEGHDHTGFGGAGGAHAHGDYAGAGGAVTPEINDGGLHTPTEMSKAHKHQTDAELSFSFGELYINSASNDGDGHSNVYGGNHSHSNPSTNYEGGHIHSVGSTGGPSSTGVAVESLVTGSACTSGWCVTGTNGGSYATSTHTHSNPNTGVNGGHDHSIGNTGYTSPSMYIEIDTTSVVYTIYPYPFDELSSNESPAHIHTINQVSAHPHTAVAIAAHANHVIATQIAHGNHSIVTQAAAMIDMVLGIVEIAGGTTMMLIVNGETVAANYDGDQTDVVITGYTNTGSNTVEIQPIVGANTKGSTSIEGRGKLFIETSSF